VMFFMSFLQRLGKDLIRKPAWLGHPTGHSHLAGVSAGCLASNVAWARAGGREPAKGRRSLWTFEA
jgi:hypothetical protein